MWLLKGISLAFIASLVVNLVWCLQCYECIGSESSDCARGINTAAVAVNCTPRILRATSRTYLRTGGSGGGGDDGKAASVNGFRPLKEQEPFIPYPACVTFTKVPYHGRNVMVHRQCLISGENFCKDFYETNPFLTCQQCNNTDFCL